MTQSTRGTVCLSDFQGCRIKLATSQSCLCHIRYLLVGGGRWGCVVVHVSHAVEHAGKTIHVRTADTDVVLVVIFVVVFYELIATQPLADI